MFILSRVVCSLEHDLRSTWSSQRPGKTKQNSLLSWVKPQDTEARVEDENVEESCAVEIPEGSSESGPISFPEPRSPLPAVRKRELWEQPF